MRRREFVTLLGGAAVLGCPRGAPGQPRERMRRIGVISYENENDADERELRDQFTARLRELGWIEGSNLHTDYRFAGKEARNMTWQARELTEMTQQLLPTAGHASS